MAEQYPTLGSAKLYIYKDATIADHTDDRIVCMRDKKMAIEVKKTNSTHGFYGLFICNGKGSEILRLMENVTHDKWDINKVKELGDEKYNQAMEITREITNFIKESIKELFPESENQEFAIPAMKEYLIGLGSTTNSEAAISTTGQQGDDDVQQAITTVANSIKRNRVTARKVGQLVVRRKGGAKKKKKINTPRPAEPLILINQPDNAQNNPHNSQGETGTASSMPKNPSTGDSVNDAKTSIDSTMGKSSPHGTHTRKKGGRHAEDIEVNFRVVPIMDDYGLIHRIIINSDANYTSCSVVIMVSGEEKDSTLEFQPIDNSKYKVTGSNRNILSGFNLEKGKNVIDIKFKDSDYHSLTIKAYEN